MRQTEFQMRGRAARMAGEAREYTPNEIDGVTGRHMMIREFAQGWDQANALIDAGPDMLTALHEVVRLHDAPLPIDQHRDPEKLWIIMQLMADAARAAIAKAEASS